jgi:hypothetical protein
VTASEEEARPTEILYCGSLDTGLDLNDTRNTRARFGDCCDVIRNYRNSLFTFTVLAFALRLIATSSF